MSRDRRERGSVFGPLFGNRRSSPSSTTAARTPEAPETPDAARAPQPAPANGIPPRAAGTGSSPLLSAEEIALQAGGQMPFLRLPDPQALFQERARRLRSLATEDHPMRDYLRFIAQVAEAQHTVALGCPPLRVPEPSALRIATEQIAPPLRPSRWPREDAWIVGLRDLLNDLSTRLDPSPARQLIERLGTASHEHLDSQADRLLNGITLGLDVATAPLISAGLQVYWSSLVAQTARRHGERAFGRTADGTACPCCGGAPTGSVVRIGGEHAGYRYLQCSLCATQWHLVRIKCAHCESTQGIHYQELQASTATLGKAGPVAGDGTGPDVPAAAGRGSERRTAAVKAECCDQCGHYLKIAYMDKDPDVDVVADDLATISLDLLLGERGLQPAGLNLMLWYGEANDA